MKTRSEMLWGHLIALSAAVASGSDEQMTQACNDVRTAEEAWAAR